MIDLPADDPHAVKLLIQYLYEADYNPPVSAPALKDDVNVNSQAPEHSCPHRHCARIVCRHHLCGLTCVSNCRGFRCSKCPKPSPTNVSGPPEQLLTHSKMYELGDRYGVAGLKKLAQEKFKIACQHFWDDPAFPSAADHAFTTTVDQDKGLRDVVRKTIYDHIALVKKPEVQAFLAEAGLGIGILVDKMEELGWP